MRSVLVLACALVLFGCSEDSSSGEAPFGHTEMSGSIRIPLTANGANGSSYRLRDATFEISGSAMMTVSDRDQPNADDSLVTPLPAGDYSLYLRPGWKIVEIKADGSESAPLVSEMSTNPVLFGVSQLSDASVRLVFKSGDKQLSFGSSAATRVTSAL